MISKPATNHTYCTMLDGNYTHLTTYRDEDQHHNVNVVSQEMDITHDFSNLILGTEEDNYESIEISMVWDEPREISNLSDTQLLCVLSINSPANAIEDSVSSSLSEFDGFHSDDLYELTESKDIPGVNSKIDVIVSPSSSSSEFEGFYSDDLYSLSSITNTPTRDTDSLDTDIDGTVIYKTTGAAGTGIHAANFIDTQNFYLMEQWNAQYNLDVIEIWKSDAKIDCPCC